MCCQRLRMHLFCLESVNVLSLCWKHLGEFWNLIFLFWGILFYFFCYWDVWWGMTNYGLFSYLLPLFFFIPDKSFWILEQIWQWPYAGFGPNLAWMRLESASLRTCELPTSTHQSFSTNWDQNISYVINQSFSHTEPGRVLPLLVGELPGWQLRAGVGSWDITHIYVNCIYSD